MAQRYKANGLWKKLLTGGGAAGKARRIARRARRESGLVLESLETRQVFAAPTDLTVSAASIRELLPAGTVIGTLGTADPDAGDSFTYSFSSGAGDTDNASFKIVGNELRTTAILDFESKSSYAVRVSTTDSSGLSLAKAFTISVTDANELSVAIATGQATAIQEKTFFHEGVGTLTYPSGSAPWWQRNTTFTIADRSKNPAVVLDTAGGAFIGLGNYGSNGRVATIGTTEMLNAMLRSDPGAGGLARGVYNLYSWLSGTSRTVGQPDTLHVLRASDTSANDGTTGIHRNHGMFLEYFATETSYSPAAGNNATGGALVTGNASAFSSSGRLEEALLPDGAWSRAYGVLELPSGAQADEVALAKRWMRETSGGVLVTFGNAAPSAAVTALLAEVGLASREGGAFPVGDHTPTQIDPKNADVVFTAISGLAPGGAGQTAAQPFVVQNNITLPTEIQGGTVTWSSSAPSVMTAAGVVGASGSATLTATVRFADGTSTTTSVYYRVFSVTANTGLSLRVIDTRNYTVNGSHPSMTDINAYLNSSLLAQAPIATSTVSTPAWSSSSPRPGSIEDTLFTYSGYLVPSSTGTHVLKLQADDSAMVYVEGPNGTVRQSAAWWADGQLTLSLEAGKACRIWIFFKPGGGTDGVSLEWKTPGSGSFVPVPAANFANVPDGLLSPTAGYPASFLPFATATPGAALSTTSIIGSDALRSLVGNIAPVARNQELNLRESNYYFPAGNFAFNDSVASQATSLSIRLVNADGTDSIRLVNRPLTGVTSAATLVSAMQTMLNAANAASGSTGAITVGFADGLLRVSDSAGRSITDYVLARDNTIRVGTSAAAVVSAGGREAVGATPAAATTVYFSFDASKAGRVTSVRLDLDSVDNARDVSVVDAPVDQTGRSLAEAIQAAIRGAMDNTNVTVAWDAGSSRFSVSDAQGRRITSIAILDADANALAGFATQMGSESANPANASASSMRLFFDPSIAYRTIRADVTLDSATASHSVVLDDLPIDGIGLNGAEMLGEHIERALRNATGDSSLSVTFDDGTRSFLVTDARGRAFTRFVLKDGADKIPLVAPGQVTGGRGSPTVATIGVIGGRVYASDANNDAITFAVVAQPSFGTVTLDPATGVFAYKPTSSALFRGWDEFTVRASDGRGGTSGNFSVRISDLVAPAETTPVVKTVSIPDPKYAEPSSKTGVTLPADFRYEDVFIAQTHVQRPSDPYLQLVQNRYALIKFNATSPTGARAPDFVATVTDRTGAVVGSLRLTGPDLLPTSVNLPSMATMGLGTQSDADSYVAPLPGTWIKPGITVTITAGGSATPITSFTPRVGADVPLTFYYFDYSKHDLNDAAITAGVANWATQALVNLPASSVRLYMYPYVNLDSFTFNRGGALPLGTSTGNSSALPGADPRAGGGGFLGDINWAIGQASRLRSANGSWGSMAYVAIHPEPGGGLGGGSVGGGGPSPGIFWHELGGHGMGRGHAADDANYPYNQIPYNDGDNLSSGWLGPNWAYNQLTGEYLPVSRVKSDGTVELYTDPQAGGVQDHPGNNFGSFSDYYSYLNYQYLASQTVWMPDPSNTVDGGFAGDGYYQRWDGTTNSWVVFTASNYASQDQGLSVADIPTQRDVPVYWLTYELYDRNSRAVNAPGADYAPGLEVAPVKTRGNLATPFRDIVTGAGRAADSNTLAGDYVMRVTYSTADGLITDNLIIPASYGSGSSFNVPDKGELVRVDIVEAENASLAAYYRNKVAATYINSESLANTVFGNDGTYTAGGESLTLPEYWRGSKVAWSTTTVGLVDLATGRVDGTKIVAGSAIRAQWVEDGVLQTRAFAIALPDNVQATSTLFGKASDQAVVPGTQVIGANLALAATFGGGTVAWSSSDPAAITSGGVLASTGSATLTARVTYANGAVRSYAATYFAQPIGSVARSNPYVMNQLFGRPSTENAVTTPVLINADLALPATIERGTVTWRSSNPSIVTDAGRVVGTGSATVSAIVVFDNGETRVFSCLYYAIQGQTLTTAAAYVTNQLFGFPSAEADVPGIRLAYSNISLPATIEKGTVTWATSNAGAVSATGVIGSGMATLTATVTFDDATVRQYTIRYGAVSSLSVASATPYVMKQLFGYTLNEAASTQARFVESDVSLPASIDRGTVTWSSSNTAVISNTGVLLGSGLVTMTATVTFDDGSRGTFSMPFYGTRNLSGLTTGGLTLRAVDAAGFLANDSIPADTDIGAFLSSELFNKVPFVHTANLSPSFTQASYPAGLASGSSLPRCVVSYSGFLVPSVTGTYVLNVKADDSARIVLSNGGVLNAATATWRDSNGQSITVNLEAGRAYPIWVFYRGNPGGGTNNLSVRWQTPGSGSLAAIPAGNLASMPAALVSGSTGYAPGLLPFAQTIDRFNSGQGLQLRVVDLTGFAFTNSNTGMDRYVSPEVLAATPIYSGTAYPNWKRTEGWTQTLTTTVPAALRDSNGYVKETLWTYSGYYLPKTTGSYSFRVFGDDLARLTIGLPGAVKTTSTSTDMSSSVTLSLTAGQPVPMWVFFKNAAPVGDARYWGDALDVQVQAPGDADFASIPLDRLTPIADSIVSPTGGYPSSILPASSSPFDTGLGLQLRVVDLTGLNFTNTASGMNRYISPEVLAQRPIWTGTALPDWTKPAGAFPWWPGGEKVTVPSALRDPNGFVRESLWTYSGYFIPKTTGTYVFELSGDDYGRLAIGTPDALRTVDSSEDSNQVTTSISLTAGRPVPMWVFFKTGAPDAYWADQVRIRVKNPGDETFSSIAPDRLAPLSDSLVAPTGGYPVSQLPGAASGSSGQFDTGLGLNLRVVDLTNVATDPAIGGFDRFLTPAILGTTPIWSGTALPDWRKEAWQFSNVVVPDQIRNASGFVRESLWTYSGMILPEVTGTYEFRFSADDEGRLYVGGNGISKSVDASYDDNDHTLSIPLVAGQPTPIWAFLKTGQPDSPWADLISVTWKAPGAESFSAIPKERMIATPDSILPRFAGYPAALLPFQPAGGLNVPSGLVPGATFTGLGTTPATTLPIGSVTTSNLDRPLVSGGLVVQQVTVPAGLDAAGMNHWVKLRIRQADGSIVERDPLEAWSIAVSGTTMTIRGRIDSLPGLQIESIKVFSDDNLVDGIAASTVTIHVNSQPGTLVFAPTVFPVGERAGAAVGTLSVTGAAIGETFTYSIVQTPTASVAADRFAIDGAMLRTQYAFDESADALSTIRIRATSSYGWSTETDLVVGTAPRIRIQPSSTTAVSGTGVTFAVVATGGQTFQWQRSTDGGSSWADVSGATTPLLSVDATNATNRFQYRVSITNARGTTTSASATLTVQSLLVNSFSDTPAPGTTTLREALTYAGTISGGTPSITFDAAAFATPRTITLSSSLPTLSNAAGRMSIVGPGAALLTIRGGSTGSNFRAFSVDKTADADMAVTVSGITFRDFVNASSGGAIRNYATLTVDACEFIGNVANATNENGGAIQNDGTLTVTASTFENNRAVSGGGAVANAAGRTATIVNSTFVGNTSAGGGAIRNAGTATLRSLTITGNGSTSGSGGGVLVSSATATDIYNSIIVGNTNDAGRSDVFGTVRSSSANLVGDGTGITSGLVNGTSGNQVGTAATPLGGSLGSLAANGGSTRTIELQVGSLALDAGDGNAAAIDQRGNARPQGGKSDIGAFEKLVDALPTITRQPGDATTTAGYGTSFTATAAGSPVPTLVWQTSVDGSTWTSIPGATSSTLVLSSVAASDDGRYYRALFTNSVGSVATRAGSLTVRRAPTITSQPTSTTVSAAAPASFQVAGSGTPAATVQWQISRDDGRRWNDVYGATSSTFSIASVSPADNGTRYRAILTNSLGVATSNESVLAVSTDSTITIERTFGTFSTTYGTAVVQSVSVGGSALSGNLTVTVPAGFEISTFTDRGFSSSSLTLTPTLGVVVPTTVYVRIPASRSVGTYSGNLQVTGGGAATQTAAIPTSVVSPKPLAISGLSVTTKTYDGTISAALAGTASWVGLVNGESFSVGGTATATFDTADAGTGKTVSVTGYTAPSGNYVVTQPSLVGSITRKTLSVTAPAIAPRAYDGSTTATITGTLSGVVVGDTVTLGGGGTFATAAVGTGKVVTAALALGGRSAGNYVLTQPTGLTATITPKQLVIAAHSKVKTYGNADPSLTFTASGLVKGDSLTGNLSRAAGSGVGTYAINKGSVSAGSNYAISFTGANLTVVRRAVTITANALSKVAGGADPALTWKLTSGTLATGDSVHTSFTGSLTRAAGETEGGYAISRGTLNAANYQITFVGTTFTILAAATPLKINGVFVKGSSWSSGYQSLPIFTSVGSTNVGWQLADGTTQLTDAATVGWNNVNTISIRFSQPIATPAAGAVSLVFGGSSASATSTTSLGVPTMLEGGTVAQWTLPTSLTTGKYRIVATSSMIATVANALNTLDGEWTAFGGSFAAGSGNGTSGGDFAYDFDVLVGNAGTGDVSSSTKREVMAVNLSDNTLVTGQINKILTALNFRCDVNGDGKIDSTDQQIVRARIQAGIAASLTSTYYADPVGRPKRS